MPDGRLVKGAARRRDILDAALRLIGREGLGAITQRRVADEAGVPASAVLYYFASVDALLVTALREVNDRYVADLATVATLADLARLLADGDRAGLAAEYDLFLLAARRDDLRSELERWDAELGALCARLAPGRPAVLVAVVNGLYLQATLTGLDEAGALAVLEAAAR
ncbi:TetR/AcrR family transcriptional regulator [Actinomycetospora atypica]|uniref:TetR/AcrR family transcriptional regulator n=1 Tax=Actinomycetospora atypica TaxID=1290095 RepID=A0ABV9YR16_9PSEU